MKNFHATAKEHQGKLIFMHTIREGFADKSYGIHVAALAGMPKPVLTRAKELLLTLESGHSLTERDAHVELPLFAAVSVEKKSEEAPASAQLVKKLAETRVDSLTPLDALNLLHALQQEASKIN